MRLAKSQSAYKSTIIFLFSSIKTKKESTRKMLSFYIFCIISSSRRPFSLSQERSERVSGCPLMGFSF